MFLFKKIISPFLFPVPLSLLFTCAGLILLWFTSRQRAGKILVSLGAAVLMLFGFKPTSDMLIRPLERRYQPCGGGKPVAASALGSRYVVVLSGRVGTEPDFPAVSALEGSTLVRLVEGIRIHRGIPGSKLLVSGGPVFARRPHAAVMARVAVMLGVSERDIVMETESMDTREQAEKIRSIVGDEPFVLVTSAAHMPRAMALFRKRGMDPIPAPTGHLAGDDRALSPGLFFPSAGNLDRAREAIYEYLGLAWSKLRGDI